MFYILYFSPQILLAFQEHAMVFPLASNLPSSCRMRFSTVVLLMVSAPSTGPGPDVLNAYSSGGGMVKGRTVEFGTKQTWIQT